MPIGRSNASSLLAKVNSQLRGERVPLKSRDEDELVVYLQSITQKTQQARSVGFEENGDISFPSGADALQSLTPRGHQSASPAGLIPAPASNKFLKKKTKEPVGSSQGMKLKKTDNNNEDREQQAGIVGVGKKKVLNTKPLVGNPVSSTALDKANALANKIGNRASRELLRHHAGDSESDESLRGADPGRRPGSADTSVGRDGNTFLKNRKTHSEERSHSPLLNYQRSSSQESKEKPKKSMKTKGQIVRNLGSHYMTSGEECLAEFIHGLSASDSLKKPQNLVTKKQQKWHKKMPSPAVAQSPSPLHMSRSPSPFKIRSPSSFERRSQSQDSDLMESMASEIMEIKVKRDGDSDNSEDMFKVNLMDISSLMPASPRPSLGNEKQKKTKKQKQHSQGKASKSSSPFKLEKSVHSMSSKRKTETKKSQSNSNLYKTLGIQMADDLLDINLPDEKVGTNDIVSEESEITTKKSDRRKSNFKHQESVSEIITELGSRSIKGPLKRQQSVQESISEHLSDKSPRGVVRLASYSCSETETDVEDDYSESFVSETVTHHSSQRTQKTESKARRKNLLQDDSQSKQQQKKECKVVVEKTSIDVAAADVHGNIHVWNASQAGISVSGPYGLQYVDPTPVSTHVVSADALEALTAYNPNMLALQDMMRSQLQLVTSFMEIQHRIYHSCLDGLKEDFQYTTLEDTKKYIQKHRKPRMSFKEALKLVDLESHA